MKKKYLISLIINSLLKALVEAEYKEQDEVLEEYYMDMNNPNYFNEFVEL